jgi:hypothetical protein
LCPAARPQKAHTFDLCLSHQEHGSKRKNEKKRKEKEERRRDDGEKKMKKKKKKKKKNNNNNNNTLWSDSPIANQLQMQSARVQHTQKSSPTLRHRDKKKSDETLARRNNKKKVKLDLKANLWFFFNFF